MWSRWEPNRATAVVTGASSGIGWCLATQLVQRGATVIGVARRSERLRELQRLLAAAPGRFVPISGDLTAQDARQLVCEKVNEESQGRLDLLVNNAGIGAIGPFAEASPQRGRQIMEVNFFAPLELTRALIPNLRLGKRSVICNVCSVLGHRAVPDKSEYCASKFAIHGWSDALRAELATDGIQVTLVSPSTTRSEFFDVLIASDSEAKSRSWGSWPAERVAQATLKAICRRRAEVILSTGGKALVYGDRCCPPLLNWILKKR